MSILAPASSTTGVHPALPRLLTKISGHSQQLKQLDSYYTGSQPLIFLPPEVERAARGRLKALNINWSRLVVNSLEERLDVDGFRLVADEAPDGDLWRIWQGNGCDELSQMLHTDALIHGRAFVIVWADPEDPEVPKITVESAEQMDVELDPDGNVKWAAKCWAEDDMMYATLYLPDSIERYQATLPGGYPDAMTAPIEWQFREEDAVILHDLGVVPVVPFFNRPRLTHRYGETELTDVMSISDGINKFATDMQTTGEFYVAPRRWATGIDLGDGEGSQDRARETMAQRWTNAPAGRVWASDSPEARFGQFAEATLDGYIRGIEMLAGQLAAIAGLPPHYVGLMSQANPASADAIRSAEASLVKRALRKQRVFGGSWERVMRLALLVRDGSVPSSAKSMETVWRDPNTSTWAQQVDAAVKLDGIGLPFRQNMESLNYSPVQIERMLKTRSDDAFSNVLAQAEAADQIVERFGVSRAAALAMVGLEAAAKVEATVEARAPGPGVVTDEELAAEVKAATPPPAPGQAPVPSPAADKADPAPRP